MAEKLFLDNCEKLKGKITPYVCELEKFRIGEHGDGGYVCLKGLPEYDCLYSLGSDDNIKFEKSFWELYQKECYVYDHTIDSITDKPDWIHFFKTGISNEKTEVFNTVDNILETNGHSECKNIIAQIDIEGYEWLILKNIKNIQNFSQIIIEYHVTNNFQVMFETLDFMNKYFYVVHVHGNNCLIRPWLDVNFPCVFEVTYIRKDLVKHISKNYVPGPLPMLDTPNDRGKPDLPLTWWSQGYGKIHGREFLQGYLEQPDDDTPNTYTLSDIMESYTGWEPGFISRLPPGSTSQLFTMFETSDVHPDIIKEMKKFDRVIVPFEYLREILKSNGVRSQSINYFSSKLIRSRPQVIPKQRDHSRLVFLYVGTNDVRKNVPALVDTFIEFSKGTQHLLIVKTNRPDGLVQSENIKVVTNKAPLEQMAALYNMCDYVISFTHGEGVGMPMLEANYFGKPIISHDQGVFRDIKNFVNVPWHVLPAQEVPIDYTRVPEFLKKVFWGTWWEVDRVKALELLKSICV